MKKILIVDDDKAIMAMLAQILADEGYAVLTAVGATALAVATAERPDLVLLDLMMPHVDGIEVSRRLRARPDTRAIPIIAMSAIDRLQERAAELRADALLPKPFDLDALLAMVARLLAAAPPDDQPGLPPSAALGDVDACGAS